MPVFGLFSFKLSKGLSGNFQTVFAEHHVFFYDTFPEVRDMQFNGIQIGFCPAEFAFAGGSGQVPIVYFYKGGLGRFQTGLTEAFPDAFGVGEFQEGGALYAHGVYGWNSAAA